MGLYTGGLIIGRIFASEIWGPYFREGLYIYLYIYLFFSAGGGEGGAYYRNFTVYSFNRATRINFRNASLFPMIRSQYFYTKSRGHG